MSAWRAASASGPFFRTAALGLRNTCTCRSGPETFAQREAWSGSNQTWALIPRALRLQAATEQQTRCLVGCTHDTGVATQCTPMPTACSHLDELQVDVVRLLAIGAALWQAGGFSAAAAAVFGRHGLGIDAVAVCLRQRLVLELVNVDPANGKSHDVTEQQEGRAVEARGFGQWMQFWVSSRRRATKLTARSPGGGRIARAAGRGPPAAAPQAAAAAVDPRLCVQTPPTAGGTGVVHFSLGPKVLL